jgi:ribonuclease VapC
VIVDTSAVMACALNEPERDTFLAAMLRSGPVRMSAGSWVELQAVVTRRYQGSLEQVIDELCTDAGIEIAPVSVEQADLARDAYRRYGIGTGHPAALNFGDCFAYALAKHTGESLLFKGDDFSRTDVVPAL